MVNIICDAEIFDALSSVSVLSRAEGAMRSTPSNVRRFNPITGEVDVNVRWNLMSLCAIDWRRVEVGGLVESGVRKVGCKAVLAKSILAKLFTALSMVENRVSS